MGIILTGYLFFIHMVFLFTPMVLMISMIVHRFVGAFNREKYNKEGEDDGKVV